MVSALPFDDIRALFAQMPPASESSVEGVRTRSAELARTPGSLGRLEAIVEWLAAWQGHATPQINRPNVVLFAASHGVLARGVARQPQHATRQWLELASAGGAPINQICGSYGLGLKVFDLALDVSTRDITVEAALDEKSAAATFAFGMEAIAGGADLLCLGAMGPGNATVAAAVLMALFGGAPADWFASDCDNGALAARNFQAIDSALNAHRGHLDDPLEIVRRIGGREICALAGAIVAARMERIPVILDGMAAAAAAAALHRIEPGAIAHCMAGQAGAGSALARAYERLRLPPLLDLGIANGQGEGAAMAAGVVKAALACYVDAATFAQAGIPRESF